MGHGVIIFGSVVLGREARGCRDVVDVIDVLSIEVIHPSKPVGDLEGDSQWEMTGLPMPLVTHYSKTAQVMKSQSPSMRTLWASHHVWSLLVYMRSRILHPPSRPLCWDLHLGGDPLQVNRSRPKRAPDVLATPATQVSSMPLFWGYRTIIPAALRGFHIQKPGVFGGKPGV